MTENKPVHTISLGTIQCTVWKNTSDLGTYYRLHIVRLYKRSDTWEKSQYFGEYDISPLIQVIQQCEGWINSQKSLETAVLSFPRVEIDDEETPTTVEN